MRYFGGIEGGATHSKLIICNETGEYISSTTGLGTNHWLIGIPECARRIADMMERAKKEGGISLNQRLDSIGLSLSGCEQEATNKELERELRHSFPDIAYNYVICSDSIGSIFTASPIGGLVLISGTGSNAVLRNPDGSTYQCGGRGHYLGDEGSGWWISNRAAKIVLDDMDNFIKSPYSIEKVWEIIKQYLSIETRVDLLVHYYGKFDKPFLAGLSEKLSLAAKDGDKLCLHIFKEAGRCLAQYIHVLLPRVHESLITDGALVIVCVGSVWFSFDLLEDGFLEELNKQPVPYGLKLVRITKSVAFGAIYLGADAIKFDLPRDYSENYKVFRHYQQTKSQTLFCDGFQDLINKTKNVSS